MVTGDTQRFMRFSPDPALPAAIIRLPRGLITIPVPDVTSAADWRTFVLNPMQAMTVASMPGMGSFGRQADQSGGHDHDSMARMMGINGRAFSMNRIDATPRRGTSEIWEIVSTAMAHPFHIHGVSFRVLANNGRPPSAEQSGLKTWSWYPNARRFWFPLISRRRKRCRSCSTVTSSNTRTTA